MSEIDNLIIIKGGSFDEVKNALNQWIFAYLEDLQDGLTFEIYKNGDRNFIVKADHQLDNQFFFLLIEYLYRSEEIKDDIQIEGFTTGKNDDILKDKLLSVYMPTDADCKDHDFVMVTSSDGKNYKIDLSGKITELNITRHYKQPDDLTLQYPEIVTFRKSDYSEEIKNRAEWRIGKRFKPIAIIAFAILFLERIFFAEVYPEFLLYFGFGLFFWFISDYRMLQSDRYYIYCLSISIAFCIYCMILKQGLTNTLLVTFGALAPMSLLIIQYPARRIFKSLCNREPVIDRSVKTFADIAYSMLLFFSPLALLWILIYFSEQK